MSRNILEKKTTITLIDEVYAIVSGVRPTDTDVLYDMYGIYTKNYFFDPRYQLKRWDGKIRFYKKTGKVFIELLPEVIEYLYENGYDIDIVDNRKRYDIPTTTIDTDYLKEFGWELGSHQVSALNNIIKTHRGIIKVGTGGGKTLITGAICKYYTQLGYKIIIIIPNADLVKQTRDEIDGFGYTTSTTFDSGDIFESDVLITTWQWLQYNRRALTMYQAFIVDECHGSGVETVLADMLGTEGCDIPIRIGTTGTLPNAGVDQLSLFGTVGPLVEDVATRELIDSGWLAKLNIVQCKYEEDFTDMWEEFKLTSEYDKTVHTYYNFVNGILLINYAAEKKYLSFKGERLDILIDIIREVTKLYGNTFVLVNTVSFGQRLAKLLGGNGVFISSKNKNRSDIYKAFDEHNDLIGIATYNLASTGLNIPRIFNLVIVDGGKSSVRVIQSIGRSIRKADDKECANVIDFYSDLKYSTKHGRARTKIYADEEHEMLSVNICKDSTVADIIDVIERGRSALEIKE